MKKYGIPVVVLTTGVTATAGMLPVLPNTTMTVGNVTAQLSGLLLARRHFCV
jgi:hypothetical protein